MKNRYSINKLIVFTLLLSTQVFPQEFGLIRDGNFEEEKNWWVFRGNCGLSKETDHKGKYALKISANGLSENMAYQYLAKPVKNFETEFWIYPKDQLYLFNFDMVANWDKNGADKILSLEISTDSLKLSTQDKSKSLENSLIANQWNKINISTDSTGFKKSVFFNDSLVGSIVSDELISVETITIGGLNCRKCFGTFFIDDISIDSPDYKKFTFSFKKPIFYLNSGYGTSFAGPTLGFGFSLINGGSLYTIRYLTGEEFQLSFGHPTYDEPSIKFNEIALLYGRFINIKKLTISLSGGVGFLDARLRGKLLWGREHEAINIYEIGFAMESQFRFVYGNFWGLGITIFSNINEEKSFVGGMIGIQLGNF